MDGESRARPLMEVLETSIRNARRARKIAEHFYQQGLVITDTAYGDPDEIQITYKLKPGWGWDDIGLAGLGGDLADAD